MALLATAIPLEPTSVRTRGGILFDPNDERWTIREAQGIARIDFSRLRGAATPKFVSGFRSTLVWYAENRSLRHLENMFNRSEHLFKYLGEAREGSVEEITGTDLLNYHAMLDSDKRLSLIHI